MQRRRGARRFKQAFSNRMLGETFVRRPLLPAIRSMRRFSCLRALCVSAVQDSSVAPTSYEKNAELSQSISAFVRGTF